MSNATLLFESQKKSGFAAAGLNAAIPGLGYMYCGRWILGAAIMAVAFSLLFSEWWFLLLGLWPIGIVDGHLAANRHNRKMAAKILRSTQKKPSPKRS